MKRLNLIGFLFLALLATLLFLGGCGGSGDGRPVGHAADPSLNEIAGTWEASDGAGEIILGEIVVPVTSVLVKMTLSPSEPPLLSCSYGLKPSDLPPGLLPDALQKEREYQREDFSKIEKAKEGVFIFTFKKTSQRSGSITFTLRDQNTLDVVEKGTRSLGDEVRELKYRLSRI
ncbi:MAG: hypothetical protein GX256_01975 [Fretibacterium sp.]|nr:hypothetical protein [Fretibacterium sp.]